MKEHEYFFNCSFLDLKYPGHCKCICNNKHKLGVLNKTNVRKLSICIKKINLGKLWWYNKACVKTSDG